MGYEINESGPPLLDRVVRGVVALLGISSLSVVLFILFEFGTFLMQEPQTAAEAHAMAHSVPGVLVGLVFGVGWFGSAGVILLTVAYLNRRRLSGATLVVTGLVGFVFLGDRLADPIVVVPFVLATLGGYALYEDTTDSDPFGFIVGATTLLWLVELLLIVTFLLDFTRFVVQFLPFVAIVWIQHLLGIGAVGILAGAGWFRYLDRPVPRAPVALAAAILLAYLPSAVRTALPHSAIGGLDPVGWIRVLVATGAAITIIAKSLGEGFDLSERD